VTRGRALATLTLATACWGSAAAASDRAVRDISAFDLLAIEIGTATVILWIAQARRPWVPPTRAFALLGLLEPALTFIAINLGLERTSASTGSLLLTLESVWGVLLAVLILRERVDRGTVLALTLGVAGAALVALGDSSHGDTLLGAVLVAAGALAAGGYIVLSRRLAGRASALAVTTWQFTLAAAMCAPVVAVDWLTQGSKLGHAGATPLIAAVFAGAVGSAGAFLLYMAAIPHVPAATGATMSNLMPVFGLLTAVVVLGERPGVPQLAGGALILAGLTALRRPSGAAYSVV
jgi:drug/metabolite transporter (DMT)-like permease